MLALTGACWRGDSGLAAAFVAFLARVLISEAVDMLKLGRI